MHINPERRRVEITLGDQSKLALTGEKLDALLGVFFHAPYRVRELVIKECEISHIHLSSQNPDKDVLAKFNTKVNADSLVLSCSQCGLKEIVPRQITNIIQLANFLEFSKNFSI